MAHELLGERFWGRQDGAAWHKLGKTPGRGVFRRAVEVLRELGEPIYSLEKVYAQRPAASYRFASDATMEELPQRAIFRHPVEEDPTFQYFGTVGADYKLLTPSIIARGFDEALAGLPPTESMIRDGFQRSDSGLFIPVETMGILRGGRTMFLTTEITDINVRGDDVTMYLLLKAPMDGGALSMHRTAIRAVCENTMTWAEQVALETFRIVHARDAEDRFKAWLREAYAGAMARVEAAHESFEVLAEWTPTVTQVSDVLATTYPDPTRPRADCPQDVLEKRLSHWEQMKRLMGNRRSAAVELFEGKATGSDTRAFRGTGWGLWQSVIQLEDRRRGSFRGGEGDDLNVAEAAIFGPRADTKQVCYSRELELIRAG